MRRIQLQYVLAFAVLGCVMPLLSLFLKHGRGFTEQQIAHAISCAAIATIVSPALITLLADLRIDQRRILAATYLWTAAALLAMLFSEGVLLTIALYTLMSLALTPSLALLDGYFFSFAREIERRGATPPRYPYARAAGTAGFVVPTLFVWWFVERHGFNQTLLVCGIAFALLAAVATLLLPRAVPEEGRSGAAGALPTAEALRTLFSRQGRGLCLALMLAYVAAPAYFLGFPLYLKDVCQVPDSLILPIINLGVLLEVFYIFGVGRWRERFGIKTLMAVGFGAMSLRMLLLAAFPSVAAGIATQVLHGLEIIACFVAPVMYLDRIAGDRFRNSMQGTFAMTIHGPARIVGVQIAMWIADKSLVHLLYFGSVVSGLALLVTILLFHPGRQREMHRPD